MRAATWTHPEQADARRRYDDVADDELAPWEIVEEAHDWSGLLLGNGSSIAVWSRFGYRSLYDEAAGGGVLTDADKSLFGALDTQNFEGVLSGLHTATVIDGAMGLSTVAHQQRYESIRAALAAAVHAVHIPWADLSYETLAQIKTALLEYDWVFTTNYDLLVYWAAMCDEVPGKLPDYFWSRPLVFDPLNIEVWNKATKLLFLHGGLHLYRLSNGQTLKRTARPGKNLLELFGTPVVEDPEAVPLFVSEGEPADKLAAIRTSEYLSFALREFAAIDGPLVIFGHSLSSQDEHLVEILREHPSPIAMSVRDAAPREISAAKAQIRARLRRSDVLFFDAATHPLGDASLSEG